LQSTQTDDASSNIDDTAQISVPNLLYAVYGQQLGEKELHNIAAQSEALGSHARVEEGFHAASGGRGRSLSISCFRSRWWLTPWVTPPRAVVPLIISLTLPGIHYIGD